jgi:hypothetical protein
MNTRPPWLTQFVAFVLTCCAMAGTAAAFADPAADPPGRVGRVSYLSGQVSFYGDQEEGWQPARLNFPVTSQNSLWTEPGGRAEIRVGATALRIDHDSVLDIQVLNDEQTVVYLQRGTAHIRIGMFEQRDLYRVQTPDGQITLRAKGIYRIDTDPDRNETRLTAFSGKARIDASPAAVNAEPGRTLILRRQDGRPTIAYEHIARTDFDDWAQTRDERWDSPNVAHISPHMTGVEDLDNYGTWEEESEYGRVWIPRNVAGDWAPYRYGRWQYVRPWGWTWVDDAPWGFAPFHYGRWVHVRGRWGWWPGNRVYRPIYSPALVAWVGNSGWNASFSFGDGPGIGWLPLAPYEAYVPWYTTNTVYIHNINYIYINRPVHVRPPRHYANWKPGATIVPTNTFHSGAPYHRHLGRVSGEHVHANVPIGHNGAVPPGRPQRHQGPAPAVATVPGGTPMIKPNVAPSERRPAPEQDGIRPNARTEMPQRPGQAVGQPKPVAPASQGSRPVVPYASMPSAPAPATSGHALAPPTAQTPPSSPSSTQPAPQPQPRPPVVAQPKPNFNVPQDVAQPRQQAPRVRAPVERTPGEVYVPRNREPAREQPAPQSQGRPYVAPQPAPAPAPPAREARSQRQEPEARPQQREAPPKAVEKEKQPERVQEGRPGRHSSVQ